MQFNRKAFLAVTGAAALTPRAALAQTEPDATLTIGKTTVEVAPNVEYSTVAYNGTVPGPVLRMREGQPFTVVVRNLSASEEYVHWHGLEVPDTVDGTGLATPPVAAGGSQRYRFAPRPAGTRWYHTHNLPGPKAEGGLFTGQFGFAIIEPAHDPGRYDREVLLALHEWGPSLVVRSGHPEQGAPSIAQPAGDMDMDMGGMPGMPGMGGMHDAMRSMLEAEYATFSINGRALGSGDPVRVRQGERVLFRVLNASATLTHRLALSGHRFEVVALDGNPVPHPQTVDAIELGAAERVDAIVTMDAPGVWVLGSTQDAYRDLGMGVVVEYAGASAPAQWKAPGGAPFVYGAFGTTAATVAPDATIDLAITQGKGDNEWLINGRPFSMKPTISLRKGLRYRMRFVNDSMMEHPMHMHGHSFELTEIDGKPTAGIVKDTVVVRPVKGAVAVDFVADNPGLFMVHCHNEVHMQGGLMAVVAYDGMPS